MRRSLLVLACAWLVGTLGCHRPSPPTVAAPEAEAASPTASATSLAAADDDPDAPEPQLLVPLVPRRPRAQPIEVTLPPPPSFPQVEVPARYDDGAYSIAGLREDLDARLAEGEADQMIEVRAYVAQIYVPPACSAGARCPAPKQPHLWLTDAPNDRGLRRALLLVGYRFEIPKQQAKAWKDQPDVVLEEGQRYTIKGTLRQLGSTGFADSRGLLEFWAYRPLDPTTGQDRAEWVFPRGASWHPLTIAQQEAENRALAERAARKRPKPRAPR